MDVHQCTGVMLLLVACGSVASPPKPQPEPPRSSEPEPGRPAIAAEEPEPAAPPRAAIPEGSKFVADNVSEQRKAFASRTEQDGTLWIGPLAGNGGRDVVIYVPPGADPTAEFLLVMHFHGTYGERMAEPQSGVPKKEWVGWDRLDQTMQAIAQLQQERPFNVALVYPISAGKRLEPGHRGWSNVMYDRYWMMPAKAPGYTDDFDDLHAQVLERLREDFGIPTELVRDGVLVEGHSAGGIALRNVAETVTDAVVDAYIFLDASFMSWADGCHEAVERRKARSEITLVITDGGIADPYGKRDPWCETVPPAIERLPGHAAFCKAHPDDEPPGERVPCRELEQLAADWPTQYGPWCAAMKNDMKDLPRVHVHRTKIPHGKQPRHFSGGLELPGDGRQ
jgi:hypothetical protein